MTEINWGYNCLTYGVHHGRPEAIWNLPLLQTTFMFTPVQLQALVVDRIYNDAMLYVKHGKEPRRPKEWADQIKECAGPLVLPLYQKKVGEITQYYRSSSFKRDLDGVIERNQMNKLNPFYAPLHDHDTINLLCRMVGQGAMYEASKEIV